MWGNGEERRNPSPIHLSSKSHVQFRGLWKASCELEPNHAKVKIVRRADRYNQLGSVKSTASLRTIEITTDRAPALIGQRLEVVAQSLPDALQQKLLKGRSKGRDLPNEQGIPDRP